MERISCLEYLTNCFKYNIIKYQSPIAQSAERQTVNLNVPSSSLGWGAAVYVCQLHILPHVRWHGKLTYPS